MGLSILNNIPSLEAQNQLATTNTNLQNTLFQLSSGSKINSGADDPAGLSIADGLQANISALTQSAQNVTDGVGMLQTADGALSQVTTLLNRAVTLATEAGNAGLTSDQQNALQTEFASITQEINQIGSNTTYNNNQVFTNRLTSVFLSDGSQTDAADPTISVTIPQLSAGSLGLSSYATGTLDLTANPTAGNTVQIGQQVYTFVASGSANNAGDVALGSGTGALQTTLQNLTNAVNGTGTAGSGSYGVGTAANTEARIITPTNGGSVSIQALTAGAAGNSVQIVANLTSNVGSVTGTLSGGVTATDSTGTLTLAANPTVVGTATSSLTMYALPDTQAAAFGNISFGANQPYVGNAMGTLTLSNAAPIAGDQVTIGNTNYTFEAAADIALGTYDATNSVAIANTGQGVAADITATLNNLMDAVNGTGGTADVNYSTGAAIGGTAMVTNVADGVATVASIANNGPSSIAFTTNFATQANVAATGGGTLTVATATGTGTTGTSDTITVGSTKYTFVAAGTATSGNEVAVGGNADQSLQNLANAVNGVAGGTANTYSSSAASAVTEKMTDLGSANAIVTAITSGSAGNGLPLAATGSIASLVNPNGSGGLSGGQDADTVQIGTQVYTFVNQGMAESANEISIVDNTSHTLTQNIQDTLANLQAALTSAGGQAGSDSTFGVGTAAAPGYATITGFTQNNNGSVTATLTAATAGAGQTAVQVGGANEGTGMNVTVTPTSQAGSLTASAWTGGVNADSVTLGNTTYTFVGFGAATQGNEVALGSTKEQTLANLVAAVNAQSAPAGGVTVGGETDAYHLANASSEQSSTLATGVSAVISSTNPDQVILTALTAGANTTTPLSASFALSTATGTVSGAGDLAGGVGNTAASGNFVLNNNPQDGNTVTIGNTAYTFVSTTQELSSANTVLINAGSVTTTLNNLKAAVTGATGTGIGGGLNYGTGTVANSMVADTASGMSSTGFVVSGNQATITSSTAGAGTAGVGGASGTGNYMVLSANLTNGMGGAVIPTPTTLTGGSNSANTKASGILALTANDIGANDQVTIGNQVWMFVSGTATGQQVQVNSNTTVAQAVQGLVSAYNALNNPTPGAGQVTLAVDASNPDQATVTANTAGTGGNNIALIIGNGNTLGGGGAGVDLSSSANAQAALTVIAGAISTVASTRGAIGSSINQMNAAVQVMSNTSQNLTSSLSGIQDANIGKVVANMSKYQVLEQTGIAALTQANQQEQTVLKLLQ
jgi:flagellin